MYGRGVTSAEGHRDKYMKKMSDCKQEETPQTGFKLVRYEPEAMAGPRSCSATG